MRRRRGWTKGCLRSQVELNDGGRTCMSLQQKIESYIENIDATFGIYIKHLGTNEEVNIQENQLFQMASVCKVPILATLYEKVYKGEIDLQERIKLVEELPSLA